MLRRSRRFHSGRMLALLLAAIVLAGAAVSGGLAGPPAQETEPTPGTATGEPAEVVDPQATGVPAGQIIPNEVCLACHNNPNLSMTLEDGELWGLFVPQEVYDQSVHADQEIACVQCHTTVGNYPHPPFSAQDARDSSLQLYPACQACHQAQYEEAQDSVHALALEAGNRNAAICTDCHTAHAVQRLTDPQTGELLAQTRQWIPQTCAKCHYAIYQSYSTSVHGAALLGESNPDVPTCIDCHGVHSIEDPTTARFRLRSPEVCAGCHTDPQIMNKYGLSTQVLDTYVADFHGTTVTLFARQHPDQEVNKPVCYDCHGIHDIVSTRDPERGLKLQENLLARCQLCHPQANINFPSAWLSHYIPSPERHPLVFTVNTFYKFFIPGVLGGMMILVALDASWRIRRSKRRAGPEAPKYLPGTEPERAGPPPEQAPPEKPIILPSEPAEAKVEASQPGVPASPEAEPAQGSEQSQPGASTGVDEEASQENETDPTKEDLGEAAPPDEDEENADG